MTIDDSGSEVLLKVEHVSLSFGGIKAIDGVSFDTRKGEVRANKEVIEAYLGVSHD